MTEETPSRRGDSSVRDDPSDVATSPGDHNAAQGKGKDVARGGDQSESDVGDAGGEAAASGRQAGPGGEDGSAESEEGEEDSEDDEDEEPRLKYARLTQHLGPVYRNGDATSAFLVAGDKMVPPSSQALLGDADRVN